MNYCSAAYFIYATLLSLCAQVASLSADETARPNILIILADDMGYSDLGCYGGEMTTPSLNQLAMDGVRLTRFHNGGMCVVSRAMMMTGQWWPFEPCWPSG